MKRAFLFLIFCMALSAWAQNQTVNGLKQGLWKVAYEGSTVIRYEGQFDRGIPVGTFTHYHPNGTKRAVMVFRGKTQACYTQEFALNGALLAEGLYGAPGVKDSTWRIYDLNGKLLSTETYQGGQLNGPFATYYPNGKVVESGSMQDGEKSGLWTRFGENGEKTRSAEYAMGMLQGTWTEFDENGRIALRGEYQSNLREGRWLEFESGKAAKGTWYHKGLVTKEVEY